MFYLKNLKIFFYGIMNCNCFFGIYDILIYILYSVCKEIFVFGFFLFFLYLMLEGKLKIELN